MFSFFVCRGVAVGVSASVVTNDVTGSPSKRRQASFKHPFGVSAASTDAGALPPTVCTPGDIHRILRVLIVDDEPIVRRMTSMMLSKKGFFVVSAANGEEAVEKFSEAEGAAGPFDVVLMDHDMPVMSGPEVVRRIRNAALGRKLLIVGVTGHLLDNDMNGFRESGVDEVLGKPLKWPALKRIIDNSHDE